MVEAVDEPTSITTLAATKGADPQQVRAWLIAQRGIVTTYAEVQRAPFELSAPVLRVSPDVDNTADDLETFAEALADADSRRWSTPRHRPVASCHSEPAHIRTGIRGAISLRRPEMKRINWTAVKCDSDHIWASKAWNASASERGTAHDHRSGADPAQE